MSHLLELVAGFLVSSFDLPERVSRFFVVLAMGVGGMASLALAALSAVRMDVVGITAALFLASLAVLCFWLVLRGMRT